MAREPEPESIGQRLRRLRLERGLSQRELAGPGVSYAYISRIEAGARRPSVKALRQLARTLKVSPEYLERGSDLREADERELALAEAELQLRLGEEPQA
ncbi:MAG: helix-turn-helix domain-containing protein, partial [Actinomycetota bacterium]|nr:helix-turn-helix domain-containing protein [Actinomycetota bacterium]